MTDWKSQRDLQRSATSILRSANFSAAGEQKDREYKRRKRAERKVSKRRQQQKQARLVGTFGAASPARTVKRDETNEGSGEE